MAEIAASCAVTPMTIYRTSAPANPRPDPRPAIPGHQTRPSRSPLALTVARIILDPGYGAAVWTRDTGRSLRPRPRQHRRWVLRATPLDTPGIRRDGVSGGAALRPTRPLVAQPVARQPEPSSRPCTGQVITTLGSVVIEAVASRYRSEP